LGAQRFAKREADVIPAMSQFPALHLPKSSIESERHWVLVPKRHITSASARPLSRD
jgi:hypothetical protein